MFYGSQQEFLGRIPNYRYLSLFAICYRWGPYLTYSVDYFIIKSSWSFTQWCSAQESSLYFASNTFFCLLCFKQTLTTKLKSFQHEFILSSIIVNVQRSILFLCPDSIWNTTTQCTKSLVRIGDQKFNCLQSMQFHPVILMSTN